jgi:hypothetical protein
MLSTMSNQPENENQQIEIVNSEEVRQSILAEIDATRQAIAELSEEELAEVAGGLSFSRVINHFQAYGDHYLALGNTLSNIYQTRTARRPAPPAK